jgi:hypothetical protein
MSASFDLRSFDPDKAGLYRMNFHGSLCGGQNPRLRARMIGG